MLKEEHEKYAIPDPFVESQQHDSIIVQIPLLHGRVNKRLEKVLCLFDQTNVADNIKVIKGMQENGMLLDAIVEMLNKTVDEVRQIEG